jgi:hypothetical protein
VIPHFVKEIQPVVPMAFRGYNWENHAGSGEGMGIRFYCPNGHKVNVKDFQAGQKGLCPVCGTAMQIPQESTRPSSREAKNRSQRGQTGAVTGAVIAPAPVAPPVATSGQPLGSAAAATSSAKAAAGGAADPLVAAGDVVWYVRPSAGGQFGPAAADVMRTWLGEERIAPDTLVWREGWPDWREAGQVFPRLSPRQAIPGLVNVVPPAVAPLPIHPLKRHKRTRNTQAIAIGVLVTIVIVLFAILLAVLMNQ